MTGGKKGHTALPGRVALAPMAGITDWPLRQLYLEMGAQYAVTEMISAQALFFSPKREEGLRRRADSTAPEGLQLFGRDPQLMADMAVRYGGDYDVIDINMGCPAKKIVKGGQGSALMTDMGRAAQIIELCAKALNKPLSVKMRLGWDRDSKNAVDFARMAQDHGAAYLCVHGRTREAFYSGCADWEAIARVKQAVSIPVWGNGDIFTGQDAADKLRTYGVDGVMIGRGALGNPWIFAQAQAAINGQTMDGPGIDERRRVMLRHCGLMADFYSPRQAVLNMRKHLAWYTKGLHGAAEMRRTAFALDNMDDVSRFVEKHIV